MKSQENVEKVRVARGFLKIIFMKTFFDPEKIL